MNADVAPAYCGIAVVVGLPICWFYLSRFGLSLLLGGMLFAIRWRQMGVATGPEFFALRFSGKAGKSVRSWMSLYSVFIGMVPWIGAGILGVHMIFGPIFNIESKAITLMIVLPVLLTYVWISGFAGVLVTDLIQTIIIFVANILLVLFILIRFDGPIGLVDSLQSALGSASTEATSIFPTAGHRVFGPLMVLIWMIVPTVGVGGNVSSDGQRIMSCKNAKEAAKVSIWTEVMLFLMLLLLTLPALGALIDYPGLYNATPSERETVYGLLLRDYLPVGVLGVALAALVASVMSTIDSHLNYGAQTLLNDVYRPWAGKISGKKAVWIGRLFMILILAVSIVVVYCASSLIGIAVVLAGLFASGALLNWGQWWWWRVNVWSWVAANVGGPIIYFTLGFLLKNIPWWQKQLSLGESMAQQMGMFQAVISICLTTILWVFVTLVTKPEDEKQLKQFYLKANPMGLWGHIRNSLVQEYGKTIIVGKPKHLILGGIFTALTGTSWIVLGILGLSELFVGKYLPACLMIGGAGILSFVFKKVFNWHVVRMEWELKSSES